MKNNFRFSFHRTFAFPAFLSRLSGGLSAVFVLLWFATCSRPLREGVTVYDGFPQTVELAGTPLPLDTAVFRYPFRIRVQADRAVVMDLQDHLKAEYIMLWTTDVNSDEPLVKFNLWQK